MYVLENRPVPVHWDVPVFNELGAVHPWEDHRTREKINESLHSMGATITSENFKNQKDYDRRRKIMVFYALAFRDYLRVPVGKHRKALIHMVPGNYKLTVVPREKGLCRFYDQNAVEDTVHA